MSRKHKNRERASPIPVGERWRLKKLGIATNAEWLEWEARWESCQVPGGKPDLKRFLAMIDEEASDAGQFARWHPKLLAYAEECRRRSPVPSYTNLDATQRGQHDLLVRLMQDVTCPIESESGRTRRDWVRILETTPIGLIAAHTLFAAARVVALLRDELHAWQEKLPAPSGPFRWYAVSSRLVEPGLPPIRRGKSATDAQRRAHDQALAAISLPPGAEPWVVTHGYSVGPLASAETEEIWAWDGREARFHSLWSDWLS